MSTETMEDRARRIIDEFSSLDDPIDRYSRLVDLGEATAAFPAEDRTEENRLPGCQYAVWLRTRYDPDADTLRFHADSDSKIVRGLAALILQVVDGQSPRDILTADFAFLDATGLRAQLSIHRSNGLTALVEEIRRRARAHVDGEQAAA
jgi:cysteine desulfuration protein SufE